MIAASSGEGVHGLDSPSVRLGHSGVGQRSAWIAGEHVDRPIELGPGSVEIVLIRRGQSSFQMGFRLRNQPRCGIGGDR